jgi:predicted nuclease of predicted toxin-antitoxin system
MNLLLDQNVYAATARFLRSMGHDVATVGELGRSQAPDEEVLELAQQTGRILLTRDRDFGGLVFAGRCRSGVVYLRGSPATTQALHVQLRIVLGLYSQEQLQQAFVTVEPGRHRFRKLPAPPH